MPISKERLLIEAASITAIVIGALGLMFSEHKVAFCALLLGPFARYAIITAPAGNEALRNIISDFKGESQVTEITPKDLLPPRDFLG